MSNDKVRTYIAFWVTGVWGITVVAAIFIKDYTVLKIITPVVLIVMGFLFGFKDPRKSSNITESREPNSHTERTEHKPEPEPRSKDLSDW